MERSSEAVGKNPALKNADELQANVPRAGDSGASAWSQRDDAKTTTYKGSSTSKVFANVVDHDAGGNSSLQPVGDVIRTEPCSNELRPETVCFGVIKNILAKCDVAISSTEAVHAVRLEDAGVFVGVDGSSITGNIRPEYSHIIAALLDEPTIKLQVRCLMQADQSSPKRRKKSLGRFCSSECTLDIILYGPMDLFDEIGDFFQNYEIYLQDPVGCKFNVRYRNPHRLSSEDIDAYLTTWDIACQDPKAIEMEELKDSRQELLELLVSDDDVPEFAQPPAIRTILERHQRRALTFMLRREQGWTFDASRPDIWEAVEMEQGHFFLNRISGQYEVEEPPEFYGGIIADPMGFGKTLSMISLIAVDNDIGTLNADYATSGIYAEPASGQTLVVVPPPLLDTWEEQLKEHAQPGRLRWCRHHAKSRLEDLVDHKNVDIILTTYHTLSAEWRSNKKGCELSMLFSTRWKRIVLDEAHFIRNADSQMAHAICALDGVSRWAVTGTPIQNRLADLATLLKFLQVPPYCEKRRFDADISYLWKSGDAEEAVKRLKRLAGCLLLRRPPATIQLPLRQDMLCPINFSRKERELYDGIKHEAINRIHEVLTVAGGGARGPPIAYINFLQQIEAMRMVCNLGLHYRSRHEHLQTGKGVQEVGDWNRTAQHIFNMEREVRDIRCHYCPVLVEMIDGFFDESSGQQHPHFAKCMRYVCGSCVQNNGKKGKVNCGHNPRCPISPVSINTSTLEDTTTVSALSISGATIATVTHLSTKVKTLITDLERFSPGGKCVVFSTWRTTLDVIEVGLAKANIKALRFDGKVPQKDRQAVVDQFRNDPSYRVLLLTLSCGAVGLTLTVASRAYLMEPHWNPTLEEQALARVHRMGQKQEVTTVRFYVKDSFEERVMEMQKSKKRLADLLLSDHQDDEDDSVGSLQRLESLL